MYEQLQAARTFLRMCWLYRWVGLVSAVAVCLIGWLGVLAMPNQFQVNAKIYLDSRSMLRPLLRGIAFDSSSLEDTTLLLSRTLLTRPNLEEVARRTDLDLGTHTPEDFDRLINGLAKQIKIVGTTRDNIYEISYENPIPKTAKAVVDELLNRFMESALGDTRKETAVTQKFLEEQIAAYEKRLLEAEERLKQFKQRNVGAMPGAQGGYFERLELAKNQLSEAKLQLLEATQSRDQLRIQLNAQSPTMRGAALPRAPGVAAPAGDPELEFIDSKVQDLQGRIADLLLNFTERHPDVIGMRKQIQEFEAKRAARKAELAKGGTPASPSVPAGPTYEMAANPFHQQLQVQTAQAEAQVAALQTRVAEYESRVKELEKRVDTVPEVEAELVRLNRDYDVNKKQYDELLQRREQAYMSQEADQSADDVKIKIIEPPRMPLIASGPNRPLLANAVLVIGLAVGGGLCALLTQLSPRIIDVPDLKDISGLPVLGVISLSGASLHRQQRWHEVLVFGGGLVGLVAIYLTQMLIYLLDVNLHAKLKFLTGLFA